MPVITMPDGVNVEFPDDMPRERISAIIRGKFPDAAKQAAAPDDHGLARRQAMSGPEKVLSPITEYPRNYEEMRKEAEHQMSTGVGQIKSGLLDHGIAGDVPEFVSGLGNTALGALGYVGSPISAAYRSVIGQPVEDVTGIPREYTEFASQLATPGIGLTRMPKAPGAPANPADLRRVIITKDEPPAPGGDVLQAQERLREAGYPVDVPRTITSDSVPMQRAGQTVSNIPIAGDPLARAVHERVPQQLVAARDAVAAEYGAGTGPNAAHRAGTVLREGAEAEARAATEAARTYDDAAAAAHQRATDDTLRQIDDFETQSLERTRAGVGDMNPQDMGQALITRLRTGEQEAQAVKNQLYREADSSDAVINADAVRSIRDHVNQAVTRDNVGVFEGTSPQAAQMLATLDKFAEFQSPTNLAAPRPAAPPRPGPAPQAGPRPGAPPAPAAPQGQSLTEFLAGKLGPDAELSAIGADRHLVNIEGTGRRRLVRQGGWDLDTAREAAEEAGYLRGDHRGTSTVNDLLDAIDAEMRGNKRFAEGFEGSTTARETAATSERARAELSAFRRGLEEDLARAGHGEMGPKIKARTLKIMEDERIGPDEAVEKALRQLDNDEGATRGKAPGAEFPGDRPRLTSGPAGPDASGGVTIQRVDEMRKYLRGIAQKAETPTDERAAAAIMRAFESWETNAFDNALVSGSPEGLDVIRRARAANRDLMERFGYNAAPGAEGAADRILNRIATGEVTPQEVSNWLVGASQIGAKGESTRLLQRIVEATGGDAEALQAIRGGVWNRLTQATEGATAKAPEKIASGINEFLNGPGRALARELFSPEQQEMMRAYADTLRRGQTARELTAEVAKNTKPGATTVEKGPLQQLASRVLGGGQKSDEALFRTIEGYAKKGGDVKALARLMQELPPSMRGDVASSLVRGLGVNRAGQFTVDQFATQWGNITPQAKAVLFGNAGTQVTALNDIALIAQRMKDVKGRYGNPSGTAQNTIGASLLALVSGTMGLPAAAGAAATTGAGYVAARVLASPAGASSVAKHARALEQHAKAPTAKTQSLVSMTERNLVNTIKALGAARAPQSGTGLRLLQGPVPAGAENEKR